MNSLVFIIATVALICLILAGCSRIGTWLIERRYPPIGRFLDVQGTSLHFVRIPAPAVPVGPPVVFVHGASGNLKDSLIAMGTRLEGSRELLFVDRPGHGWSQRPQSGENSIAGQARLIAALMDDLEIAEAIIVGHSFGGAVTASFALEYPQKTTGLLFVSAATHPWPGGTTSWYYDLASRPLIGPLFSHLFVLPLGFLQLRAATRCVFSPNPVPNRYLQETGTSLVLRPDTFIANAQDVQGLHEHVTANAPRYSSITAPTIIISGDSDTVVYSDIHSHGLAGDIPGSRLICVQNLGHKPDYIAGDLVVAALDSLSGHPVDLQPVVDSVERRIADDATGPCAPSQKSTMRGMVVCQRPVRPSEPI